jgi:hypothetical protein
MGFFDAPQSVLAQGRSVFYGELYRAGFLSGPAFYWDGFGNLAAYDETWLGQGQFVQRTEIPFGVDDDAGQLTLTLSGVDDEVIARVRAAEAEFYGRPLQVWGQFFDEALALSGARFHLFAGTMDCPTYGGTGPGSRWVTIPCEGEWSDRNGAAFEFFTNASQQKRYPGDKGLEYVYRYHAGVLRPWPHFG